MSLILKVDTRHKPEWFKPLRSRKRVTLFKKTWVWGEDEEKLYGRLCVGSTLHLCSGYSDLGDERIDLNRDCRPSIVADVHYLPFKDASFDTIIIDPPWYGPQNWMKWEQLASEMCRVARRRIIIILGALIYILPKPFTLKEVYLLKEISPMVKLVYVWDRPAYASELNTLSGA